MGTNTLTGQNIEFPIYKADGSSFYGLVLRKTTFDSVVMSLGDKITGDVVYENNELPVSMNEYIEYAGVKYTLVNPPTVVREGLAKDNSDLKGMTRYSFEFYHPMYQLGNLPFSDVAVSSDEQRYLSENKVFSWIGKPNDYIAKLNKNLENTQWIVVKSEYFPADKLDILSDVIPFDKATIADALKTWYDTWKVPYIVDTIKEADPLYAQGKRFCVIVGFPANEILDTNGNPYIFEMGQGVGLKNNSRTPKNNKIVTRIAPYGSERNIPYGYPQIVWTGNQDWEYTINNDPTAANSYPIYDGIVGGRNVRLIKHPFTRKTLMPSIYATLVNKKVNPNATGYDPTIELVDYYDATSEDGYPNPINPLAPSYEAHEFSEIYPRLGEESILGAEPYDTLKEQGVDGYLNESEFLATILNNSTSTKNADERAALLGLYNALNNGVVSYHSESQSGDDYQFVCDVTSDADFYYVKYTSSNINYDVILLKTGHSVPVDASWNDKMDDDGNYVQSYFKVTLPVLNFDMYACASITEEMKIYMRSGACIGCTFNIAVDWDDYKKNFYDNDGNFAPDGTQRDLTKYPKTNEVSVTVIVQKDIDTFGTLMPNIYQQPKSGDKFVVLGISLPLSYITDAEEELDDEAKQYMLDNNVYYYEYPLKFDEHFLAKNENILSQIKPNSIVRFKYNGEQDNIVLYVKQMTIKYGYGVLPQYDITITDDIEVVLNKIGQVTDNVSRLNDRLSQLTQNYNGDNSTIRELQLLILDKLSRVSDDTAQGFINFLQGIQVGNRFVSGILGEGGVFRRNADGKVYLETDNLYVRMKAYFDTVEVRHYKHSSGNRIASNAGIHCSRVAWIDANGNQTEDISTAVKFRCFFRATDGDDTVENYFMAASDGSQDLAFCDRTSLSGGISKRRYWRAVVGKNAVLTDDGEAWIDLSKSDCESGSDIPMAGDDIIQLGNRTDKERQGAIIEYVNGNDAPSYHIYQFINDFDLSNKNIIRIGFNSGTGRAEMNVYGDAYIGDPNGSTYVKYNQATRKVEIKAEVSIQSTFGGQTFEEKVAEYAPEYDDSWIQPALDGLQDQIDGELDTWYYAGVPTLNNLPASQWNTDELKNDHVGDLYYDKSTGYAYRFVYDSDSNRYSWTQIHDDAISEALRIANNAQDTADNKRRVFVRQPLASEAYDVGDLWVNATYSDANVTYSNEVLRCNQSKAVGVAFSISHWEKASKYTDDSKFDYFFANTYSPFVTTIEGQIDKKAETWYFNQDPSTIARPNGWYGESNIEHVGDIWHNTSSSTIDGVESGRDAIWNGTSWEMSDVPQSVYDTIDGKADIFVVKPTAYNRNDMWIIESGTAAADMPTNCVVGDIVIADNLPIGTDKRTSFVVSDWRKKDRYTDDTYAHGFDFLTFNLARLSSTEISGGLVLSSLIGLRDINNFIQSGINGITDSAKKGNGIAAWYGGEQGDLEDQSHYTVTRWAKSLFRFDGSGYLASGNITWDKDGRVAIKDITTLIGSSNTNILNELITFNNAFHFNTQQGNETTVLSIDPQVGFTNLNLTVNGVLKPIATQEWVGNNYVSIAFFNSVFQLQDANGNAISPNNATTAKDRLKILVGAYTDQYLSALGLNPSGGSGGGGGVGDVTWDLLANDSDTRPIAISHLTTALSGYATQSWVNTNFALKSDIPSLATLSWSGYSSGSYNGSAEKTISIPSKVSQLTNDAGYTTNVGTVTQVKVGTDAYNPSSGVVSLPAYPTTLPASDVYAWAKASSKPSYSWSEIGSRPTALSQFTNDSGYVTSSGSVNYANYSEYSNKVLGSYTGNGGQQNPNYFGTNRVGFLMMNTTVNSNSQYKDWIIMDCYSGNDIGGGVAFGVNRQALGAYIMRSNAARTSWEESAELIGTHNYTTYTVKKDGTGASGSWGISVTGNANTATKLQTAITIWGQSFDGTANVSGAITGATTISASSNVSVGGTLGVTGNATLSGTLSVSNATTLSSTLSVTGATTLTGLLTANGGITIPSGKTLTIGDAVLSWDATNQAIRVSSGLYSVSYISALGANSSGGGGGIVGDYLPLTGGTITGSLTVNGTTDLKGFTKISTGDFCIWCPQNYTRLPKCLFVIDNITWSRIEMDANGAFHFRQADSGTNTYRPIYANAFIKGGGTSSQFLKADGSVDGNAYITSSALSGYIHPTLTNLANGDILIYDSVGSWVNTPYTSLLSGYATQSWVTTQLGDYLPLTGGTITGNLTVNGILTASDGDLDIYSAGNSAGRATIFEFTNSQDVNFNGGFEYFFDARINASAFNNTSDIRKKNIIGDVPMNLYNVANAPLFKFTWKGEKKYSGQHVGSAAQYWQTVLPELVNIGHDKEMTLAMQYDVIALASAITVAKKVVDHEERIKILENENKKLRLELEKLRESA